MAQRTRSRVSSVTWGSSLKTRDTVFALTPAIRATTTRTGLRVQAELDTGNYPTGIEVSKKQMKDLEAQV
ncbi:MAG TPA: hypothetical protein VEH31_25840, partial [Streptosporangiaceae bacterium]|nr:hypothetical protein [Streptosporangiaceae bacterium]